MYIYTFFANIINGDYMENIDIRNYIIENFKNDNPEKIRDSIETTIKFRDEDALLGLGVLFELLWNNSNDEEKENYLKIDYFFISSNISLITTLSSKGYLFPLISL